MPSSQNQFGHSKHISAAECGLEQLIRCILAILHGSKDLSSFQDRGKLFGFAVFVLEKGILVTNHFKDSPTLGSSDNTQWRVLSFSRKGVMFDSSNGMVLVVANVVVSSLVVQSSRLCFLFPPPLRIVEGGKGISFVPSRFLQQLKNGREHSSFCSILTKYFLGPGKNLWPQIFGGPRMVIHEQTTGNTVIVQLANEGRIYIFLLWIVITRIINFVVVVLVGMLLVSAHLRLNRIFQISHMYI